MPSSAYITLVQVEDDVTAFDPEQMFFWIGVPLILATTVFARFRYFVDEGRFVIDIRALALIPIYRRSFRLDRIVSLRRFLYPRDLFSLATPAGRLLSTQRCIVEFSGWRRRRLVITPDSFEALQSTLAPYIVAANRARAGDEP